MPCLKGNENKQLKILEKAGSIRKKETKCLYRIIMSECIYHPNYILTNEVRLKYLPNYIIKNEMMNKKERIAGLNKIRSAQLSTIYPIHTSTSHVKDSSQQ